MRTSTISLTVGLALAACSDGGGPSTEGTLLISTATGGEHPDQDGYLLRIDGLDSVSLSPTGSAEKRLSSGRHILRLFGIAEQCSVVPGDSLEVDVPPQGTARVTLEVSCPAVRAPGFVRITVATTGPLPDSSHYEVWAEHFGAWDYGGAWVLLGTVDSNGTMVAELAASSESGADPYWYLFHAYVTAPCGYLEPRPSSAAPGFTIAPGDTLDVVFTVTCTSGSPWDYGRLAPAKSRRGRSALGSVPALRFHSARFRCPAATAVRRSLAASVSRSAHAAVFPPPDPTPGDGQRCQASRRRGFGQ